MALTLLTLAGLPLAAAGPGASVETFDGDGPACASEESWWYEGNWTEEGGWSWQGGSWSDACSDHYDYAAVEAHDDAGTVARVSASASRDNSSESSASWYDSWSSTSSYSSRSHRDAFSDAWSRDAAAETRAGRASASYGCASASGGEGSASWSWYESGASGSSSDAWSWASRCGVTADAVGSSAFVGQRCASNHAGSDGYNAYGNDSYGSWHRASGSLCFLGADAAGLSGGLQGACADESDGWWSATWDGNETRGYDQSYASGSCENGVLLVGPDGAVLFAGHESRSMESCTDGACEGGSQSALVVRLAWEHNPLHPGETGMYVPLP